jgi:hypothetical protein
MLHYLHTTRMDRLVDAQGALQDCPRWFQLSQVTEDNAQSILAAGCPRVPLSQLAFR